VAPGDRRGGSSFIADIETLRALSIAMVLVAHLHFLLPWPEPVFAATSTLKFGAGVDLFFAISGYVISATFWRSRRPDTPSGCVITAFLVRRFFRLWPAAALAVGITYVSAIAFAETQTFGDWGDLRLTSISAVASLTWLMNFWGLELVQGGRPLTLLAHFWSLSLEEQFYLVFPFAALLSGTPGRLAWIALAAAVALAPVSRETIFATAWWFRFDSLALGIVVYGLQRGGLLRFNTTVAMGLNIAGITGLLASSRLLGSTPAASTLTSFGAMALVAVAAQNKDYLQFSWNRVACKYLGSRSYTIYLWHLLIYTWLKLGWGAVYPFPPEPTALVTIGMLLMLAPATLIVEIAYRCVETRSRALGRRIAGEIEDRT
jgi:peptidoglycan/LPS O-acetylase OafA/YrhL